MLTPAELRECMAHAKITPPYSKIYILGMYNPCDDSAQRCEIYKYVDKHAKLCQAAVPICDGGCMLLTQL